MKRMTRVLPLSVLVLGLFLVLFLLGSHAPVAQADPLLDVSAIAAGVHHTCVLTTAFFHYVRYFHT